MSDLQIGLAILGLFIIGGVVAFNWHQDKQFRKRAEHGFKRPEADALLGEDVPSSLPVDVFNERIDPSFVSSFEDPRVDPEPAGTDQDEQIEAEDDETVDAEATDYDVADEEPVRARTEPAARVIGQLDPAICYVAEIRAGEVVPATAINGLEHSLKETGRKYRLLGYDYHKRSWEPVSDPERWYTSIRVYVQLVDRGGAIAQDQLEDIARLIHQHADSISGICEAPDTDEAMSRALALDDFCVDVDIIVGLSVAARQGQVLHGTQLRALAEANGLKLDTGGVFRLPDGQGGALFTMDNQESNQFRAGSLKTLTTRGVTFLLDVPRTANGVKVFNKMLGVAKQFAESLDAMLCDDNRVMLNESGLEKIRNQLRMTYDKMEQRGIPAGGETARQLFS